MFEFMKIINETRYRSKAFEQLWKQFPELEEIDPNPFEGPWEIRCFQEAMKPYVMVKHVIVNNTMVRIEWYEYYKNEWHYVGYWTREDCVQDYRRAEWEQNKNAFRDKQEFERWLSEPEHRHFKTSDEEAARVIRDKFLEDYGSLHLKK